MDKFDDVIKNAKEEYQPRKDFVDTAMARITSVPQRRKWHVKIWGSLLTSGVAVAALAFIILPKITSSPAPTSQTSSNQSAQQIQQPVASQSSSSTDNTSLQNDLNSVGDAISVSSTDQSKADSALNDSQQQIAVPTD